MTNPLHVTNYSQIAPGIDIDHEIDESANSSDSPDNINTFLRPSDSAFLQPSDAFLQPSADSASAFFHPSSVFSPYPHEEEMKPNVNLLSSASPTRATSASAAMYSPPGMSAGTGATSSSSNQPYGVITPPGTAAGTPHAGPGKDSRGATGGRSPYHSEL